LRTKKVRIVCLVLRWDWL